MENNKQLQTSEKHPYLITLAKTTSPEEVNALVESMAFDTVKFCLERAYDTPSIKKLASDDEARVTYVKAVKMMLTKMNLLLNLKEGFKPEQVNVIPSLLLDDYGHLVLNDINMVCKGILTGKYKIYERLDTETFFRCVREYDASDERIQAREDYNRKDKGTLEIHPDIAKELSKDIKKIGKGQTIQDAKLSMRRAMERYKQENDGRNE